MTDQPQQPQQLTPNGAMQGKAGSLTSEYYSFWPIFRHQRLPYKALYAKMERNAIQSAYLSISYAG